MDLELHCLTSNLMSNQSDECLLVLKKKPKTPHLTQSKQGAFQNEHCMQQYLNEQ